IVQTALAAMTFPDFPNWFTDPFYDMAVPLLRGGHVNGTLWHSDAAWPELILFVVLMVVAICLVVLWSAGGRGWRSVVAPASVAGLLIAVQAIWGAQPEYVQQLTLADVIIRMGYTCDADALRIQ